MPLAGTTKDGDVPLADLTSQAAVRQALDEFDALGREGFLEKYGFGRAREYFVLRSNRLYDSKAIAGAAYGYQFPIHGPLSAGDFSGGEATVQRKLEELGFEIVRLERAPSPSDGTLGASAGALEKAFHARLIGAYNSAKAIGYNATRFLGMVSEHGGLEAARILLHSSGVSDGYTAMWERGRLDLTVEAIVLEAEWATLFSDTERRTAIARLKEYGYTGNLPDL
jgi:hypothetical protein